MDDQFEEMVRWNWLAVNGTAHYRPKPDTFDDDKLYLLFHFFTRVYLYSEVNSAKNNIIRLNPGKFDTNSEI